MTDTSASRWRRWRSQPEVKRPAGGDWDKPLEDLAMVFSDPDKDVGDDAKVALAVFQARVAFDAADLQTRTSWELVRATWVLVAATWVLAIVGIFFG